MITRDRPLVKAICGFRINPYVHLYQYCAASIRFHGSISEAARAMGMERRTLQRMMKRGQPKK